MASVVQFCMFSEKSKELKVVDRFKFQSFKFFHPVTMQRYLDLEYFPRYWSKKTEFKNIFGLRKIQDTIRYCPERNWSTAKIFMDRKLNTLSDAIWLSLLLDLYFPDAIRVQPKNSEIFSIVCEPRGSPIQYSCRSLTTLDHLSKSL